MNASDEIKDLALALVAAQKKIDHARRASTAAVGSARQYRYADLAAVWDACREPLTENGLAVVQTTKLGEGAHVLLTRLVHSSGQWVESETPILAKSNDPQGFGSAMTYARRYALSAIVGVAADDDDDGEAARTGAPPRASSPAQNRPAAAASRPSSTTTPSSGNDQDPAHVALATDFKRRLEDLEGLHLFGDFVRDLDAAGLPRPLLDDVRAEIVVIGVRFAVEQEDLEAWVPKLQDWKLEGTARDRAAQAWEKRSDELAQGRAA